MTVLAAASTAVTQEPNRGWGNLVGLLAAVAVFWVGKSIYERFLQTKDGDPASPLGEGIPLEGVKSQVTGPADPKLTPGGVVAVKAEPDLDSYVKENAGKMRTKDLKRTAAAKFKISESTIKRALRRVRDGKS